MLTLLNNFSGTQLLIVGLAYVLVLVLSLTLHEFSHAFVAYKNGDTTAKFANRVSINPLVHIDTMGFICCLLFGFGWAKPVPINPNQFRNIKKGLFWTSIAGVLMNLLIAFIFCPLYLICIKYLIAPFSNFELFLINICYFAFVFNICLLVFNLIPVYPLDGFNILQACTKYSNKVVVFLRLYGSFILLGVLLIFQLTNIFDIIINWISFPIIKFWQLII